MGLTNTIKKRNNWVTESYSNIPYEIGCVLEDSVYSVYEVDERGVPEIYLKTDNETEAQEFLEIVVESMKQQRERRNMASKHTINTDAINTSRNKGVIEKRRRDKRRRQIRRIEAKVRVKM